jgi:H+/Cl- antiporter ClcA
MKDKLQDRMKLVYSLLLNSSFTNTALQAIPFWVASLLAGIIAVAFTRLFIYTEGILQSVLHWKSWLIFIITPISFLLAWLIVRLFAPNAKGSGIPQVMAAIELSAPRHAGRVDFLLSIKIGVIKILSSLLMVLGGGAIGREGPTIQISGSIFYIIQKYIPSTWPKLSKQAFILTGASAGLAAAFNTPLGGLVFAIEELSKIHIRFFRTALFSAVIIAGLTAQAILGPYLYLGYPNVSNLKSRFSSQLQQPPFLPVFQERYLEKWLGGSIDGKGISLF